MSEQNPGIGGESLFDNLPKDLANGATPFDIRQMFDGTVFNGSNGIRVVFGDAGDMLGIDSVNLHTGQRAPSFRVGETGGFKGEGGFYGESTVMGKRLKAIVAEAKSDWQMWKETEGEHPGVDFRTWKADRVKAMAGEVVRLSGEDQANQQTHSRTRQNFHDFFIKLERDGKVPEEDLVHLQQSKDWEAQGLVKPLE